MKCGASLHFQSLQHADHECIVEVWLQHWYNRDGNHEGVKHECICGIKWTNDPVLAAEGKTFSQEIDITPNRPDSLPEIKNDKDNEEESDKPN